MPILKWFPPEGAPRTFALYKPVTTVGRALGNDVSLASPGVADTHVQILFDGRDFNLEEVDKQAEILLNGKKKRRARLVHGDRITLGGVRAYVRHVRRTRQSHAGEQQFLVRLQRPRFVDQPD